jgi:hypothetical protein
MSACSNDVNFPWPVVAARRGERFTTERDMPPRDPNPKRPSPPPADPTDWHGKRKARQAAGGASWQSRPSRRASMRSWLAGKRLIFTALLLVVVAVFVVVLRWKSPPTPLIAVAFHDYKLPFPPNAWSYEDVEHFKQQSRPVLGDSNLQWMDFDNDGRPEPKAEWRKAWLESLTESVARAEARRKLPVLVYVSAHGVVDGSDEPCLVAPGHELLPESWLPVKELVERLGNAAKERRVVLFLDANRLAAHWALGMLYNDFAERLKGAVGNTANVLIVNSTSPGQVGWASPKLGGSVFGRCVLDGLRGAASADGSRVTLGDLLDYTAGHGGAWAVANRGVAQEPYRVSPNTEQTDRAMLLADVRPWWQVKLFSLISTVRRGQDIASSVSLQFDDVKAALKEAMPLWQALAKVVDHPVGADTLFEAQRLRRELAHWQQRMAAGHYEAKSAIDELTAIKKRTADLTAAKPGTRYSLWATDDEKDQELNAWRQFVKSEDATVAKVREQLDGRPLGVGLEPIEWRWSRLLAAEGALGARASDDLFQALNQRNLAEKAAWPRDARAHYALRAHVDAADELRRRADDELFSGGTEELREARMEYDQAIARYTRAAESSGKISEAFLICDQVLAELIDLAQAVELTRRFTRGEAAESHRESFGDLIGAIERTHKLHGDLEGLIAAGAERSLDDLDSLQDQPEQLRNRSGDLAKLVQALVKQTLGRESSALADLALSPSPAVLGRGESLERYFSLVDRDQASLLSDNAKSELAGPSLPDWPWHPVTAIMRLQDAPSSPPPARTDDDLRASLRSQGAKLRQRLAALLVEPAPTRGDRAGEKTDDATGSSPSNLADRTRLADDVAGLLAAAALLAEQSDGSTTIVPRLARLRHFDRAHFLVWQAERALRDFWGPAAWPKVAARGADAASAEPYYWQILSALLDEIDGLVGGLAQWRPGWVQRLRELLGQKREFTLNTDWVTSEAEDDDPESLQTDWKYAFRCEPSPGNGRPSLFAVAGGASSGDTVVETDAGKRRLVELGPPREGTNPFVDVGAGDTLRLFFRGHVADAEIPASAPPRFREIRHALAGNRTARIQVQHEEVRPLRVAFLLDCSGSMDGKDAVLDKATRKTRMPVAKESLLSLLEGLSNQKEVEASLWLLGATFQRYGSQDKPKLPDKFQNPDWKVEVTRAEAGGMKITTANDVLQVVPLQPWNKTSFKEFKDRYFDRINAYGWTPLYHAIAATVGREFPEREARKRQLLVIISDGKDQVDQADQNDPDAEVQKAVNELNARPWLEVAVLNCGDNAMVQAALRQKVFDNVKNRLVPVPFVPPTSEKEFRERLQKAVGVDRYEYAVITPQKSADEWRWDDLWVGQEKALVPLGRSHYALRLARESGPRGLRHFLVEGGETVIWQLTDRESPSDPAGLKYLGLDQFHQSVDDDARRKDVANPFDRGSTDTDLNPRALRVAAVAMPDRDGGANRIFRIAIQNGDPSAFSPRPMEAWVEVKPLRDAGAAPDLLDDIPFIFCDLTYDDKTTSAPVLVCKAVDWPADARQAEVRVWWTLEELHDRDSSDWKDYRIGDLIARGVTINDPAGKKVASISVKVPPTKQEDPGARVIVIERHVPGDAFRPVRLASIKPPDTTTRRYFPTDGKQGWRIKHEFVFRDEDQDTVSARSLRVAPRRLLRVDDARAIQVNDKPLIVAVP